MAGFAELLSRHRAAVCAAVLISAIVCCRYMPLHIAGGAALLFAAAAALRFSKFGFLLFFPLGLAVFLTGADSPDAALSKAVGEKAVITGWLYENAQKKQSSVKIPIQTETVSVSGKTETAYGKILLYSNGGEGLVYGDSVKAVLRVKPVTQYKNPGFGNYKQRLAEKSVFFTAYADARHMEKKGVSEKANPVLRLAGILRKNYAAFIRENLPPVKAEIVNALSIGEKGALPDSIKRKFAQIGIGHLLAISGLHVGVAAVFFYMSVKWLLKRSEYILVVFTVPKIAAAATIPAVFLYCLIAGLGTSSVRAAIMAAVYLAAILCGRRDDRLNSLSVAAIIILLSSPGALFEASFILSFSAVLGILLVLNRGKSGKSVSEIERKTAARKILSAFSAAVATTAAATAATLPFVINMFGVVPVMTFPANMAAMPIALAMVPLCITAVCAFAALGFVPGFLLDVLSLLASALTGTANFFSNIFPVVAAPVLDGRTVLLFYCAAAFFLMIKRSPKILYGAVVLSVCLTASAAYDMRPAHGKQIEASFFDSGRKNIALFTFRDGKTVLIKGGFSKKARSDFVEKAVISPALLAKRVTKIDLIVMLSNDQSQINGTAALIEKHGAENLWINSPKLNDRLWKTLENNGVKWKKIYRSEPSQKIAEKGGVRFNFLHLSEKLGIADSSVPYPLLVKIVCGETSFLLMESIQNIYEKNVEKFYRDDIKSDVAFIPEINRHNKSAVIAVIKSARPRLVVCANCESALQQEGLRIRVRETRHEGTVSVFTDGEKITGTRVYSPASERKLKYEPPPQKK